MHTKKRKVDSENKNYVPKWTEIWLFFVPNKAELVPVCLICQQTVFIIHSSNVKQHFETKHNYYDTKYPMNRYAFASQKIESLHLNYSASKQILNCKMSAQGKCAEASLCFFDYFKILKYVRLQYSLASNWDNVKN